jgi:hypothetical protein
MTACHSFTVHTVTAEPEHLPEQPQEVLDTFLSSLGTVVQRSIPDTDIPVVTYLQQPSLFAVSIYDAFVRHCPLKLNPNTVWLTVLQGFAIYVSRNAELLRDKFVSHSGKQKIVISRPDFRYQNPSNDWASIFPQFAAEVGARTTPGIRSLLECNFSNTTPTDRACSHIALLDICRHYFEYEAVAGCGIPRIDLLGRVQDWRLIRRKADGLRRFAPPRAKGEAGHLTVWLNVLTTLYRRLRVTRISPFGAPSATSEAATAGR